MLLVSKTVSGKCPVLCSECCRPLSLCLVPGGGLYCNKQEKCFFQISIGMIWKTAFIYGISVKFSYQEVFICRGLVKFSSAFFFFLIKIPFLFLWDFHAHSRGITDTGNLSVAMPLSLHTSLKPRLMVVENHPLQEHLQGNFSKKEVTCLNPHCTHTGLSCFLHGQAPSCPLPSPHCMLNTVCCLFNRHKTSARWVLSLSYW